MVVVVVLLRKGHAQTRPDRLLLVERKRKRSRSRGLRSAAWPQHLMTTTTNVTSIASSRKAVRDEFSRCGGRWRAGTADVMLGANRRGLATGGAGTSEA